MFGSVLPLSAASAPTAAGGVTPTIVNSEQKELRLWYDEPAPDDDNREWKHVDSKNSAWETLALALGNSYMGAKVFGLTERERIQISENTLSTSGGTQNSGTTNFTEVYLHFDHTYSGVDNYTRDLVLNNSISHVEYTYGGVNYTREYFTSYPDKVMVIKLTAEGEGNLNFTLEPKIPYYVFEGKSGDVTVGDISTADGVSSGTLTLEGHLPGSNKSSSEAGYVAGSGTVGYEMDFEAQFRVFANGGTMTSGYTAAGGQIDSVDEYSNGTLTVSGANSAYILIALGTNYEIDEQVYLEPNNSKKLDGFAHPHEKVTAMIEAASAKSYDELVANHVADYTELFSRVSLDLGSEVPDVTTDELLDGYGAGDYNPYVEELMFAFGRYILISSSRSGNLPPNLNGIWNRYHNAICLNGYWGNVNIQMNFWSAFSTDLAECFESYVELYNAYIAGNTENAAKTLINNGVISSRDQVQGQLWSMGTGMTPFVAASCLGGRDGWGNTPYMAESFWDYYDYTRDESILRDVSLPALISSANFLSLILNYDEEQGLYLTPNSGSPEQSTTAPYLEYVNRNPGYVPQGTTYDQSMTYSNYVHILDALSIIDESTLSESDRAVIARIREQIDKLDPIPVGLSGQVKEFREENFYGEIGETNHRHISHLTGLYPGSVINLKDSPAWADAAGVSLDRRGESYIWGWSYVTHILSRARIGDGDYALEMLRGLISSAVAYNLCTLGGGNFQVEANLGTPAAIGELLLQSHEGYIAPLASLPQEWESGSFSGLVARGNFSVAAEWEAGLAKNINVTSRVGGVAKVFYPGIDGVTVIKASDGSAVSYTSEGTDLISFDTNAGETYLIGGFRAVEEIEAPQTLSFSVSAMGQYKLAAAAVDGAVGYNLYVANGNSPKYTLVDSSVGGLFSYEADAESENVRKTFAVTAVNAEGRESDRALAYYNPADTSASIGEVVGNVIPGDKLQITVSAIGNSSKFKVYSAPRSGGERTLLCESVYPIINAGDYDSNSNYYVSAVSAYDGAESEAQLVSRFGSVTTVPYNSANILEGKTFVADSRASTVHSGQVNGQTEVYGYSKLTDNDMSLHLGRFSTRSADAEKQVFDGTVDFGGAYILDELKIFDFNPSETTAPFMGTSLVIQAYSLGQWTTVVDCKSNAEIIAYRSGTNVLSFKLDGVRAEKLNIYIPGRLDTNSISIYEISCSGVYDSTKHEYSNNLFAGKSFVPTSAALAEIHADNYGYQTLTDTSFQPTGGRFSTKSYSNTQVVDATLDFGSAYKLGELRIYDFNGHADAYRNNPTYAGTSLIVEAMVDGRWVTVINCQQADYAAHRVFKSNTSGGAYLSFDMGEVEAEKVRIYIPKNCTGASISLYEIECSGYATNGGKVVGDVTNIIADKEFEPGALATDTHEGENYGYAKLTDGDYHYQTGRFSTVSSYSVQSLDGYVYFGGTYRLDEIHIYDFNGEKEPNKSVPSFVGTSLLVEALVDGVWVKAVEAAQSEYASHRVFTSATYAGSYLTFDLGGIVAEAIRVYIPERYDTSSVSVKEIKVMGAEYVYGEGQTNRDNIFDGFTGADTASSLVSGNLSDLFDGKTDSYVEANGANLTLTLGFGGVKVLNDLRIYEKIDGMIGGVPATASDSTKIEVQRDGVWHTVYSGIALSELGRNNINMLGIDCTALRISFTNTRLFDTESSYRSAKINEISCTTSTEPVDRTALLEAYVALENLDAAGAAELEAVKRNALTLFLASLQDVNATQEAVDEYTAELDSFTKKLALGESEEVAVTIGHSCSFQNDISLNYYIPDSGLDGHTDVFLLVERDRYVDGVLTPTKAIIENYTVVDGNLRFAYRGIAACEMGDTVRATLYSIKDGVLYTSPLDEYSVKTYAYNRLANSTDAAFKTLLVDMLNYGAAAQVYFGYDTDNLVNRDLTDEQKALATAEANAESIERTESTVEGAIASIDGRSVVFNSNVELKYYIRFTEGTDVSALKLVLTYTTVAGVEKYIEISGSDFVYVEAYRAYSAKCVDIAAADMSCEVYATVYDGITPVSNTEVYSIESYVANRLAASTDESFKILISEMYKYSESARKYFTEA